ncbi:MAG: hypothetical protein V3U69_02975, partial [Bacteroidota bacterium]
MRQTTEDIFTGGNSNDTVAMGDVTRLIKERSIQFVELKFLDLLGGLQHMTLPIEVFDERLFI